MLQGTQSILSRWTDRQADRQTCCSTECSGMSMAEAGCGAGATWRGQLRTDGGARTMPPLIGGPD